jgi:hypothetical protein
LTRQPITCYKPRQPSKNNKFAAKALGVSCPSPGLTSQRLGHVAGGGIATVSTRATHHVGTQPCKQRLVSCVGCCRFTDHHAAQAGGQLGRVLQHLTHALRRVVIAGVRRGNKVVIRVCYASQTVHNCGILTRGACPVQCIQQTWCALPAC